MVKSVADLADFPDNALASLKLEMGLDGLPLQILTSKR